MEVKWPSHDYQKLSLMVAMIARARAAGRFIPWKFLRVEGKVLTQGFIMVKTNHPMLPRKPVTYEEVEHWYRTGKLFEPKLPSIL